MAWDAESLQNIRLVGDRRYRRAWGLACLGALAGLAAVGVWGVDFREQSLTFFFVYWACVLATFLFTMFLMLVDYWSIRLEFAMKRRELAKDFLQETRAAAAPRNGKPRVPKLPRL